jgi:DUF971 family protein
LSVEEKVWRPSESTAEFLLSDHAHSSRSASLQGNEASRSPDGRTLDVTLETGAVFSLSAERLRAACRCARCRRAQIDGLFAAEFPSITIANVAPIGHYAVNIEFSDDHARGIYPWSYLAELATDCRP